MTVLDRRFCWPKVECLGIHNAACTAGLVHWHGCLVRIEERGLAGWFSAIRLPPVDPGRTWDLFEHVSAQLTRTAPDS